MLAGSDFRWLLDRLKPMRSRIVLGLLCMSFAGIAATIDPLMMRSLIDRALPQGDLHLAMELAGGIGLCYFGRSALYTIGSLVNFSIAQHCIRDLRIALLDQMNRLSADYHEQTPTGEKLTRIEHDVDEIANLGAETANQSLRAVLFFVLNLVMMARLNLPMTLTVLPLMPLFAIIQRRFSVLLKTRADEARSEVGVAASMLNEHLAAIPQIQLLGAEERSAHQARSLWEGMLRAQWVQRRTQVGFSLSIGAILVAAILVVLALGSAKVVAGTLTIGGLVAFYAYATRVFDPISSAMDLYARLQTVGASIRRVRELLVLEPSVRDTGTIRFNSPQLHRGFRIEDVSFSYGGKPALRNIMLRIDPGERLAIIGASGSGKSTLARLLVRAADPEAGCIFLEEQPLACYTLASLRDTVRFVPQHPVLFQGTIRENLLYGNPLATTADMLRTIEAVQLAPVLRALPHGLDTPLGPGAAGLSGGERQRLAIARSLLRESAALILDEATSALDAPTEYAVFASLAEFRPHQTLIVISHHISSLTWVDRFALLDQGRIVATGDHTMLYAQSALYRTLFDASAHNGT
ncbi:ABC transporter ATP-binding protein [Telmatobacter bradus]|uniref:ABC transporter ATP-binding protein n=1 Tax=Telmatobacter bradus TaxID=474953 RepID=UPI003B42F011